jgi:hypothetical protein
MVHSPLWLLSMLRIFYVSEHCPDLCSDTLSLLQDGAVNVARSRGRHQPSQGNTNASGPDGDVSSEDDSPATLLRVELAKKTAEIGYLKGELAEGGASHELTAPLPDLRMDAEEMKVELHLVKQELAALRGHAARLASLTAATGCLHHEGITTHVCTYQTCTCSLRGPTLAGGATCAALPNE